MSNNSKKSDEQLKKDMSILKSTFIQEKNEKVCVGDILKRPEMDFQKLIDLNPRIGLEKIQTGKQCWIEFKYSGYISRQSEEVQRAKRYSSLKIPVDIDYANGETFVSKYLLWKQDTETLPDGNTVQEFLGSNHLNVVGDISAGGEISGDDIEGHTFLFSGDGALQGNTSIQDATL